MVAVAYGVARVPESKADAASTISKTADNTAPAKSWLGRVMDAFMESRMRQADREIAMYRRMLGPPYSFDERGNRLVKAGAKDMPFGGW
jgi:hypothetical protein